MSVSNVNFTDNGLRDFYLGTDDALDSALEGQLEDFRSGDKVPDADGSDTIDEQRAMVETIKKLEQRMADFEGVSIGGFAPAGNEDYPFDRAGLKREFLDEVLAALIQSSNTLTTVSGDGWAGEGYLNVEFAEVIEKVELEVYRLETYRELDDYDFLDVTNKYEDNGSQLTLDAWLLEIFQIGKYEDTGLRTYDGSGASTGVDENWPGGDDDITSVTISPGLNITFGLDNSDDGGFLVDDTTYTAGVFADGLILDGDNKVSNPRNSIPWNLDDPDTDTREYTLTAFKEASESLLPDEFGDFSSRYNYDNQLKVFPDAALDSFSLAPVELKVGGVDTEGVLVKGDITIEVENKINGDKVSNLVESGRLTENEKLILPQEVKTATDYEAWHDVGLLRSNEGNVAGWLNYETKKFHLVAGFDLSAYKLNVKYGVEKDTRPELLNAEGVAVFNHYSELIDKIFAKGDELQRAPVQQPLVVTSIPGVEVTIDGATRVLTGLATLRKPTDDPENPAIEHYAFDEAGAERYKVVKAAIQNGQGEVVDFSLDFKSDPLSAPSGRTVGAEELVFTGSNSMLAKPINEPGALIIPGSVVIHLPGGVQVTDDGIGNLAGPAGLNITGTVDYETGSVSLNPAPSATAPVTADYRFLPPVEYYKLRNSGVGGSGGILDLSANWEIENPAAQPLAAIDLERGPQHLSGMEYIYYWNEVRIRNFRGQLKLKETIISEIQEDLRQANAALAKLEEQAGKVSSNPEESQSRGDGSVKAPQVTETLDLDVYEAMIATSEKNQLYGEDSGDDLHDYVEWQVARTNLKNYIDRRSADAQSATLDYQTVLNRYNTAYEIMAKLQEKLDSLIKTQLRNW